MHTVEKYKKFKVGIVGCGRVAEHHLKFLVDAAKVEIVGLVDKNINQARFLGEKYNIPNTFSSIDELLEYSSIDVMHILSPPQFHFDLAEMAIRNGSHLLIEKPMTLSFEDAKKLYKSAEERNVKLCPDFIHLFNPLVLEAKASIEMYNLGQLINAECYMSINLNDISELTEAIGLHWSYELPGGVMLNYITHPLYLVFDWIGRSKEILTYPRQFGSLPQGLTDHVDVIVEGEKATGKITLAFAPKHENYYLKLFFDKGTVTIDFTTQTYTLEKVNSIPRTANRVLINFVKSKQLMGGSIKNVISFLRKKVVPYHGIKYLIDSFYSSIDKDTPSPITKELVLDVSYAEEEILKQAGKVHFDNSPRPSSQKGVTKKEKILVTGSTGYLGREVVDLLVKSGYYVRAYVRKTSHTNALEKLGVEICYGDMREADKVATAASGMDIIVHVAAGLKGSQEFIIDSCVKGTENIAEAARSANVKKVIYISSFGVYDYLMRRNSDIITEDSQLESKGEMRGLYSFAKRQAEDIAISNLSCNEGPAWTILRPSLLFGNKDDVVSLIGPKIGNFVLSFGKRNKHLKLVHVKDVAKAILCSIEKDSTNNCKYNISHEDQITVEGLAERCLKDGSKGKFHVIYIPYLFGLTSIVMLKILKLLTKKSFGMNKVRLAYLCRDLLTNSKEFSNATGWQPSDKLLIQLLEEIKKS